LPFTLIFNNELGDIAFIGKDEIFIKISLALILMIKSDVFKVFTGNPAIQENGYPFPGGHYWRHGCKKGCVVIVALIGGSSGGMCLFFMVKSFL
jgi:hypothetical protein